MKIGVLVHGYNVNAPNWQEVVWRDSAGLLGRLPQAVKVILQMRPVLIVFGTGASFKDGKVEAEIMRDYLLDHLQGLVALPDLPIVNPEILRDRIAAISYLETKSKNTFEEIRYASYMFREAGVEMFCSVSSPDHISRCAANANQIFSEEKALEVFAGRYSAWPSQVPYGAKGKWPVIVESPHRLYPYVQKLVSLPKEEQEAIIRKATG